MAFSSVVLNFTVAKGTSVFQIGCAVGRFLDIPIANWKCAI
jgi:hypothetical protein